MWGWNKGGKEGQSHTEAGDMVLASAPCLSEEQWAGGDSDLEFLKPQGQEESFLVRVAVFTSHPTSLGSI